MSALLVERRRRLPLAFWLALALAIVVVDQLSKALVVRHFALHESMALAPFLNLVRAHNTGAAFSFLAGEPGWQRWFFTVVGIAASVFIVHLLRRHAASEPLFATALTLILGGAVGNVIDRITRGYVVDFVDVHALGSHFPSFNVADSAITLGAICLVADELRRWRRSKRPA